MSECIHGLGPVECCTICNGRDRSAARADDIARRTVSHQWGALYPGSCVVCREEFVVNEAIGRNADGGYVCSTCAIVESPPPIFGGVA